MFVSCTTLCTLPLFILPIQNFHYHKGFFYNISTVLSQNTERRYKHTENNCVQEAITLFYWDCFSIVSHRAVQTSAVLPWK